ncbi:MAG: response regulator [Cyanobacteria bacterium J06639_14]
MAHIVILEDDIALADYWQQLLENEGHQVIGCSTVAQALEYIPSGAVDLIIADMIIKDPDQGKSSHAGGLTLISKRDMGKLPKVPILGVSGHKPNRLYAPISPLAIAKDMGVDLALYKPIRPDTLLKTVHKLLNQTQASAE